MVPSNVTQNPYQRKSVLPKPGKDTADFRNVLPISILNKDVKLLAKILATRLNKFLHTLIHKDQSGFIPVRQVSDNIRRALNFKKINIAKSQKHPSMLLSIALEKAFNTISWKCFFYHTLELRLSFSISQRYSRPILFPENIGPTLWLYLNKVSYRPGHSAGVPFVPLTICLGHRATCHCHKKPCQHLRH